MYPSAQHQSLSRYPIADKVRITEYASADSLNKMTRPSYTNPIGNLGSGIRPYSSSTDLPPRYALN